MSDDLISRQAAIDVAMQYCPDDDGSCSKAGVDIREMLDELESLPPAQSEWKVGKWIRVSEVRESIKELPSAQPERKKGKWVKEKCRGLMYKCSACGNYLDFNGVNAGRGNANFCPNCGAVMDEREDND